jgi:hypothetical protein
MPSIADFDQLDNPYRSSRYSTVEAMPDAYDDPEVAELQAFVGPKAKYYLRKWAPRLESPDGEVGMNWAAFFLTAFWMGYRKMYRNVALYFVATFAIWVPVELLFVYVVRAKTTPGIVSLLLNLMVALVCGAFGNVWYLEHAKRKIAAVRAQGLEGQHRLYALAQRGGTSLLGSIGLVFGAGFALLIVGLVLGVIIAIVKHAGM